MKQPRSVTFLYGGIAVALLLVIATVALVLVPASAPSIAEFAPRAEEAIEDAPDVQSSRFGSGAGACGEVLVCDDKRRSEAAVRATLAPERREIVKARVRRCVGDPPRQTEDPQSPPCVNYWEGDNGGATAKGVTRDEIRIAVPRDHNQLAQPLLGHFNGRYELYGRTIRAVEYRAASGADGQTLAAAAAAFSPFAAIAQPRGVGRADQIAFARATSRAGIVSATLDPYLERDDLTGTDLAWTYNLPADVRAASAGSFACSSLIDRPARFAGVEYQLTQRKFGIVATRSDSGEQPSVAPLRSALARCGIDARVYEFESDQNVTSPDPTVFAQMRVDGVTTALVHADRVWFVNAAPSASAANYHPEWVLTGLGGLDNEFQIAGLVPADQRTHLMAVFPENKIIPVADDPTTWALREGGSDYTLGWYYDAPVYRLLLELTSGFQLAGPRLTPQTFASGLAAARFPNPGSGAAPYHQARVGFASDRSMIDDVSVSWWSDAQTSYHDTSGANQDNRSQGAWCYVDRGRRYAPDAIGDVESKLFLVDPGACR